MPGAADDPAACAGGGDPADRVALRGTARDGAAVAVEARSVLEPEPEQELGHPLGFGAVAGGRVRRSPPPRRPAARRRPSRRERRRRRRRCSRSVRAWRTSSERSYMARAHPGAPVPSGRRAASQRRSASLPGQGLLAEANAVVPAYRGQCVAVRRPHRPSPALESSARAQLMAALTRSLTPLPCTASPAPSLAPLAESRPAPRRSSRRSAARWSPADSAAAPRPPATSAATRRRPGPRAGFPCRPRRSPPPAAPPGCRSAPVPPAPAPAGRRRPRKRRPPRSGRRRRAPPRRGTAAASRAAPQASRDRPPTRRKAATPPPP